jgi:hypothetical protein
MQQSLKQSHITPGTRGKEPARQSPAPFPEALVWGMVYGGLLSLLGWGLLLRMLL